MSLARIDQTTFEMVFPNSKNYFLLCVQTSPTLDENLLKIIEIISNRFSKKLQTYLVVENDLGFFQNRFNFWGTPTYILLQNGMEKGRLLGAVSKQTMIKFISNNLNKA